MGKQTLFDNLKEWIGGVGFDLWLWSVGQTQEGYWKYLDEYYGKAEPPRCECGREMTARVEWVCPVHGEEFEL